MTWKKLLAEEKIQKKSISFAEADSVFERARKKRHYLIYGAGLVVSKTEAVNLIKTAENFLKIIGEKIDKERKQDKLFK